MGGELDLGTPTPGGKRKREWDNSALKTKTRVPLLDLQAQLAAIKPEVMGAIERVVDSQKFILGDEVAALEAEIAEYCGCAHAVGCASGSDALLLALMAYDIGPGDEVLTVPYSFFATVSSIVRLGAAPVFVDIDAATFNMNVDAAVETLRSRPKIRAVIPVHLFGACVDLDPILDAARDRGILVIEDAAQSIGSEYKGRRAGSFGDIGCFSFFPSKNLGAFGDAGLCTAADSKIAAKLKALRMHGSERKYYHGWLGVNSRLDALQAAVLRVKLRSLDQWSDGRARNAELYRRCFSEGQIPVLLPQSTGYQTRHIYNQFVIRGERRDALRTYLSAAGIDTEIYYPLPLHLQACFAGLGYKPGDMPVSEAVAAESLALPVYPELDPNDIRYVVDTIHDFYSP